MSLVISKSPDENDCIKKYTKELLYIWDYTQRTGDISSEDKDELMTIVNEGDALRLRQNRVRLAKIFQTAVLQQLSTVRSLEKYYLNAKSEENRKLLEAYWQDKRCNTVKLIEALIEMIEIKNDEEKHSEVWLFRSAMCIELYQYLLELKPETSEEYRNKVRAIRQAAVPKITSRIDIAKVANGNATLHQLVSDLNELLQSVKDQTEKEEIETAQRVLHDCNVFNFAELFAPHYEKITKIIKNMNATSELGAPQNSTNDVANRLELDYKKLEKISSDLDPSVQHREEAVMFRLAEIVYVHDSKQKNQKAVEMAEQLYVECCDSCDCEIAMINESMSLLRDNICFWMMSD